MGGIVNTDRRGQGDRSIRTSDRRSIYITGAIINNRNYLGVTGGPIYGGGVVAAG